MERRVLSWAEGVMGDGMEEAVWKELDEMEGMGGIPCKDTTFL